MRVSRTPEGRVRAEFEAAESLMVAQLTTELVELLDEKDDSPEPVRDPVVERLLPDAYRGDDEAAAEFRRFTEPDLVALKRSNLEAFAAAAASEHPVEVDEAALLPWLRAITDLRLALAVRLGIESDDDEGDLSDAADATRSVYWWLGSVQEGLIAAL